MHLLSKPLDKTRLSFRVENEMAVHGARWSEKVLIPGALVAVPEDYVSIIVSHSQGRLVPILNCRDLGLATGQRSADRVRDVVEKIDGAVLASRRYEVVVKVHAQIFQA